MAFILTGATLSRPGAFIKNLYYKDIKFYIFPFTAIGGRAYIGIVINLIKIKKSVKISKLKKYGFYKKDILLYNPVLYI